MANAKAVAALTEAKSLIDTPEKWGRKAFAFQGKLCLMEAVMRSCKKDTKLCSECVNLLKEVWGDDVPYIRILTSYNDTHTHEEVMSLLDGAILLANKPEEVLKETTKVIK